MNRPSKEETFLHLAAELAQQSTCSRRAVGCVLVDARWEVLGLGYNGVPAGWPHCWEEPCPAAEAASGTALDGCRAIHAEQNALLRCRDIWRIDTCLVTTSPCVTCVKLLLNTSCRRIVFVDPYPHEEAQVLWQTPTPEWPIGREWKRWPGTLRAFASLQERSIELWPSAAKELGL